MESKNFGYKGYTLLCAGMPTPDGHFVPHLVVRADLGSEIQDAMPPVDVAQFNSAADAIEFARMAGENWVEKLL